MVFGVPTMYHRLGARRRTATPATANALADARAARLRLGAARRARVHRRIEQATGQRIVERYGLTETIMNTAVRADGARRPGYVGPPRARRRGPAPRRRRLRVDVPTTRRSATSPVRGPEPLPRLPQPARGHGGGHGRRLVPHRRPRHSCAADGYWRIVGRRATDLIKTGGYKVGAGEVEAALLEHPAVLEAAVTGEPDDRPRRAHRRLGRAPTGRRAGRAALTTTWRPARPPQAPARRSVPRRAAPQRDGQGRKAALRD